MHPILDALDGTPHEWIKRLLFTFNEGNIGKFEALAPLFPKEVRCVGSLFVQTPPDIQTIFFFVTRLCGVCVYMWRSRSCKRTTRS